MKKTGMLLLASALAGCTSLTNPFAEKGPYAGINPPRIHVHPQDEALKDEHGQASPIARVAPAISEAEREPFVEYYKAMNNAKEADNNARKAGRYSPGNRTKADKEPLIEYATKGIALVNASCVRWFHNVNEAQIRLNHMSANRNVFTNLGTTLLGLASANKNIVGTYGALNTAVAGVEQSYMDSFMLAPNANKVKTHIFSAMSQRADAIKNDAAGNKKSTFADIYDELERYADICTQHTAKEIINSALDQTTTTIVNGQVRAAPTTQQATLAAKQEAEIAREKLKKLQEQQKESAAKVTQKNDEVAKEKARAEKLEKTNVELIRALESQGKSSTPAPQPVPQQ